MKEAALTEQSRTQTAVDVKPRSGRDDQDHGGQSPPDPAGILGSAGDSPVLLFPVVGGARLGGLAEWPLTAKKLAEYAGSFPGIDVMAECRAARQWCLDNPANRKTYSGLPAFLCRWLTKAQNASTTGKSVAGSAPPRGQKSGGDRIREMAARGEI